MNQMMQNQAQIVGQVASQPRVIATGDVLVPMNYISGEFPTVYPVQLEQYQITRQVYSQFINELNTTTMAIMGQQQQAQSAMMSQAMTGMGGTQGVMGKMAQFQAQMLQI